MIDEDRLEAKQIAVAVDGLVSLIRLAPPDVFEMIANGDRHARGGDDKKHLAAVNDLLKTFECRLDRQPDNSWLPSEVIELVSYGAGGRDKIVVAVANAF